MSPLLSTTLRLITPRCAIRSVQIILSRFYAIPPSTMDRWWKLWSTPALLPLFSKKGWPTSNPEFLPFMAPCASLRELPLSLMIWKTHAMRQNVARYDRVLASRIWSCRNKTPLTTDVYGTSGGCMRIDDGNFRLIRFVRDGLSLHEADQTFGMICDYPGWSLACMLVRHPESHGSWVEVLFLIFSDGKPLYGFPVEMHSTTNHLWAH